MESINQEIKTWYVSSSMKRKWDSIQQEGSVQKVMDCRVVSISHFRDAAIGEACFVEDQLKKRQKRV